MMTMQSLFAEPSRVDEPRAAQEFSDVLSQVAADGKPLIVRRNGADLAAVISLEHLELLREIAAQKDVELRAAQIDWARLPKTQRPPQQWFDDSDNPFEPEQEPTT
jgi:prevent-host-death family protein